MFRQNATYVGILPDAVPEVDLSNPETRISSDNDMYVAIIQGHDTAVRVHVMRELHS